MEDRDSCAVLARRPSALRVRREASAIFFDVPEEATKNSTMAITTTVDNSGSSTIITTSITSRVIMLASSGSPAVTATSCILATSLTTRCTVSALRLREWNCWERRCTWLNTRLRNDVAAREPTSEKATVAR